MKVWPQKTWKKILLVMVLILIAAFASFAVLGVMLWNGTLSREIVSPIDVVNAEGSKTALMVYQPGFSNFPKDACYAFADGLASIGWRVEITTASPQAPSDFSKYSLLALVYPVYGSTAGTAIVNYAKKLNAMNGLNTVIIACQGGTEPSKTIDALKQYVQAANGSFYTGLSLSTGDNSAIANARQTGSQITP